MEPEQLPGEQRLILTLTINLDSPLGQLQRALMRRIEYVSFALTVLGQTELTEYPRLPDVLFQLQLGRRTPVEELPTDFKRWVLTCGVRDLVEALEPFLEETWKICWILRLQPGGPRPAEELQVLMQQLAEEPARFHRLMVSQKLSAILAEYPALLPEEWVASIRSVIGLRNCLVHRRGIVGERDCEGADQMTVTWRELTALFQYEDGSTEPVTVGFVTQGDGVLGVRNTWTQRTYQLGETVQFNAYDFSQLAMTLYVAACLMRDALLATIQERGIEVAPPGQTNMPQAPENGAAPTGR